MIISMLKIKQTGGSAQVEPSERPSRILRVADLSPAMRANPRLLAKSRQAHFGLTPRRTVREGQFSCSQCDRRLVRPGAVAAVMHAAHPTLFGELHTIGALCARCRARYATFGEAGLSAALRAHREEVGFLCAAAPKASLSAPRSLQ